MSGLFFGLFEIFRLAGQSEASDHNIPHRNILRFSQYFCTSIAKDFSVINQQGKHNEYLTYLGHKRGIFQVGKHPNAHCARDRADKWAVTWRNNVTVMLSLWNCVLKFSLSQERWAGLPFLHAPEKCVDSSNDWSHWLKSAWSCKSLIYQWLAQHCSAPPFPSDVNGLWCACPLHVCYQLLTISSLFLWSCTHSFIVSCLLRC